MISNSLIATRKENLNMKHITNLNHYIFKLILPCFCFVLLSVQGNAQPAGAKSAAYWVKRIQDSYSNVSDFSSRFTQTYRHPLKPELSRSYGKVYFMKGGLMRWEYEKPEPRLFVFDGAVLWIFEPEMPQVIKTEGQTEKFRRYLAFLTGTGRIDRDYTVELLDGSSYDFDKGPVLGLKPRDPQSPYKFVEMYIDEKKMVVSRSVLVQHEGGRNRIDFMNPEINTGVSHTLFRFSPPPGVPVVSPAEAAKPAQGR